MGSLDVERGTKRDAHTNKHVHGQKEGHFKDYEKFRPILTNSSFSVTFQYSIKINVILLFL